MAENKKSFVLYADMIHTIEKLPDNKAGKLFKHIMEYVNDRNPVTDDIIVQIAFEPIKQQLKRDLKKFEAKKQQWSEAGKKSAEVKKQRKSTESTDVESVATESTVNVTATVNDNVNDTVIVTMNTHEVFSKRLLDSDLDKEAIEISNKEEVTSKLLNSFNAHLTNESKQHSHYSEYKKHLVRWMPKRFKPDTSSENRPKMKQLT